MSAENIYMLGICLCAILFLFFIGPLKFIFKIVVRSCVGLALIYFINWFLCSMGDFKNLCIGINFISAIASGLLGFPGILSLYVIKSIL